MLVTSLVTLTQSFMQPQIASAAEENSRPVILLMAPFVTWADITSENTPTIFEVGKNSTIGDVNARSRAKNIDGAPSIIEGALTISSGAWARIDPIADAAYNVNELFEYDTAASTYERTMGEPADGYEIVYLGLVRTLAANSTNSFKVIPGTLGQAVLDARGTTAAFGNSDLGFSGRSLRATRPAAIAAMDKSGRVKYGSISETMLKRDPDAPYGVQTDLAEMKTRMIALKENLSTTGPNFISVDSGDLYRARNYSTAVAPKVAERQWSNALKSLDQTYAMLREVYPDATIIFATQASKDLESMSEGFGPLMITPGKPGLAISSSTHREGLVTNLDVTAALLEELGLEQPVQVLGAPITSTSDFSVNLIGKAENSYPVRLDLLKKMNATALAIENNRRTVLNLFISMTVLILAAGALTVFRADRHWDARTVTYVRRAIKTLILGVLAVPAASWLMFLIYRWPSTPLQVTAQLLICTGVLWLLAALLPLRFGYRASVIFLAGVTSAVIIIDQLLGAPASFTSFFGYSPITAARFYGIGNEGAAVLFGAVVIGLMMALDQWPHWRFIAPFRKYGIAIIGAIVVFVSAAPNLGVNVGVAAWGVVGFAFLWYLANGKKINFKALVIMAIIIVFTVGLFIALENFGSGSATHLGKSLASAEQGGIVQLWDIVVRKAETNLRVLLHTNFVWILFAVIAFFVTMRMRPSTDFAMALKRNPNFGDGMTTILIAGLAAYFTEDSGVVLPALMVLYLGCGIVWIMLEPLVGVTKHGD